TPGRPMTRAQSRAILLLASAYNTGGGIAIIFFLDALSPLIGFEPATNMLFRLFVGGTTITFGIAYFNLAKAETYRATDALLRHRPEVLGVRRGPYFVPLLWAVGHGVHWVRCHKPVLRTVVHLAAFLKSRSVGGPTRHAGGQPTRHFAAA